MQKIAKLIKASLVQNIISLFGIQVAQYIFPLITMPYLARVLGPKEWGIVAFTQSFGAYLSLIIEYGFNLSATREVARNRGSKQRLEEIVAGVLGAKIILAIICTGIALICYWVIPAFKGQKTLLLVGLIWAIGRSFNLIWYFQGFERMRIVALFDIGANLASTIGLFLAVKNPQDGYLAIAIPGITSFISVFLTSLLMYREVAFSLPTLVLIKEALSKGKSMFFFRSAVSLYTTGNAFILGLFVAPQTVGYYASAEKISKASLNLLNPISQSLFPRVSSLVKDERDKAAKLVRASLLTMGLSGACLGLILYLLAPMAVELLLGRGFDQSVLIIQAFSFLPVLIAVSNVLGIQWMLPLGLDKEFNLIITLAGFINLGLAVLLTKYLGALGMACAVSLSEAFVTGSMIAVLIKKQLNPLTLITENLERAV